MEICLFQTVHTIILQDVVHHYEDVHPHLSYHCHFDSVSTLSPPTQAQGLHILRPVWSLAIEASSQVVFFYWCFHTFFSPHICFKKSRLPAWDKFCLKPAFKFATSI